MAFDKLVFSAAVVIIASGCSGVQIKKKYMDIKEYKLLSWEKKIDYFTSLEKNKSTENKLSKENKTVPGSELYKAAFMDEVSGVVIAALKSIPEGENPEYKAQFYVLLKHKNPVIRWQACQQISVNPSDDDLHYLSTTFSDSDWMVRECAFKNIRLYKNEKNKKQFLFPLLYQLNEKNPQTLKQVYKTLKWYEDDRVFTFIYKRLFHATDPSELIIIMREISEYKYDSVKQRLWYLSNKHSDFFVRDEAAKLLNSM